MMMTLAQTSDNEFGAALRASALVLGAAQVSSGVLGEHFRYRQAHAPVAVRYLEVGAGGQRPALAEPADRRLRTAADASVERDARSLVRGDVAQRFDELRRNGQLDGDVDRLIDGLLRHTDLLAVLSRRRRRALHGHLSTNQSINLLNKRTDRPLTLTSVSYTHLTLPTILRV